MFGFLQNLQDERAKEAELAKMDAQTLEIQPRAQPTPDTCVSTCLSMALGLPVEIIMEEFHVDYLLGKTTVSEYLTKLKVPFTALSTETTLALAKPDKLYFVTVPSLNRQACLHYILIRTVEMDAGEVGLHIYDPAKGLDGRLSYVLNEPSDETEVILGGHILEYELDVKEVLLWRKQNI